MTRSPRSESTRFLTPMEKGATLVRPGESLADPLPRDLRLSPNGIDRGAFEAVEGWTRRARVEEPGLFLHGMGHFHPENVIDNAFLESLDIGTSDAWILERVGIRRRHTVLPLDYIRETKNADPRGAAEASLHSNVDTAVQAAAMAMERAGLKNRDIGMVVSGGCTQEMAIPAEAARIAAALDIDAPAFDLNSACSTFGAQLHLLRGNPSLPAFVLVLNPENTTRVVDYRDRSTAVLWGDGTAAAVVSPTHPSRLRIVGTALDSAPASWRDVTIPLGGHFAQRGSAVQRFAITTTLTCLQRQLPAAMRHASSRGGALRFIGHQANRLVLEAVLRRAALDEANHWSNVELRGNTGAAGAPSVLSEHWDALAAGDAVVMAVVGAGLSWSSLRIEVDE